MTRFDGRASEAWQELPSSPHLIGDSEPRRTLAVERLLLLTTVVLMPLLDTMTSSLFGFSYSMLFFAAVVGFVGLLRPRQLIAVVFHRLFLALGALLFVCAGMEMLKGNPSLGDLFRIGMMLGGASAVAALCRDRASVRTILWGYGIVGLILASSLLTDVRSALSEGEVESFRDASALRGKALSGLDLSLNLNQLAFFCSQGCVAFICLSLQPAAGLRTSTRPLMALAGGACGLATFMTVSRSGILFVALPTFFMLSQALRGEARRANGCLTRLSVLGVVVAVVMLMPQATWMRMAGTTLSAEPNRRQEARARIYTAAWDSLGEYWLTGVGAGTYASTWAVEHGVYATSATGQRKALGMHSIPLQFWVLWGLPALLMLCWMALQTYRSLPARSPSDLLALSVWAIAIGLALRMAFSHMLHGKEYAIGFGLIAGASRWTWSDHGFEPWERAASDGMGPAEVVGPWGGRGAPHGGPPPYVPPGPGPRPGGVWG